MVEIHRILYNLAMNVKQSIIESWLVRIGVAVTTLLLLHFTWTRLIDVFSTQGFGPHGECLLWLPSLITLFVGSDTSIGLAYVSISTFLIYFVCKTRNTIPFQWIFVSFGIFIVACGTIHFVDVLTLWVPVYWLEGTVKLLTALASVTTALALPPQLPKILMLIHQASLSEEHQQQLGQARNVLQQEAENQNQSLVLLAQEVALHKRESQQAFFDLQRVNEELKHAIEMQRDFVATASHEFRTALATIKGFSELMCEEILDPEEVREYATDIVGVSDRLTRMITNLLDLERMKSGQMVLSPESTDLNVLLKSVLDHHLTGDTHTFHFQLDDTLPLCLVDTNKITQVITNLLSNAIKYSPDGGEILVGSRIEQGKILMWVRDHGVGISPEYLEDVFVPYCRIDTTRYIKGTGLGLSISRQIVQMHGGQIWVESTLSQGSCFQFTLPIVS